MNVTIFLRYTLVSLVNLINHVERVIIWVAWDTPKVNLKFEIQIELAGKFFSISI